MSQLWWMRVLWDTLQSSTSLIFFLQFSMPLSLSPSFSSSVEASFLSFLSNALSWWWCFSFHGFFPSGWGLISPLLLYLLLQLHGWKSPLKDLSEAQRSSFHRSFSSKLPSICPSKFLLAFFYKVMDKAFKIMVTLGKMKYIVGPLWIVQLWLYVILGNHITPMLIWKSKDLNWHTWLLVENFVHMNVIPNISRFFLILIVLTTT